MVRRRVMMSVVSLACLGPAACNNVAAPPTGTNKSAPGTPAAPVEVGSPLYAAAAAEKIGPPGAAETAIVIPNAVVRLDEKQTVPAQVDGYIDFIGTPLPAGTAYDPNNKEIQLFPDFEDPTKKVPYRRLEEGMRVVRGQEVALFNDREILIRIETAQNTIKSSEIGIGAAQRATTAVQAQLKALEVAGAAVSPSEKFSLIATVARYEENVASNQRELDKAKGEEKAGWNLREKHRARCMVKEGVITKVMHSPGEYLRAGEPVMEILSTAKQQVEGNLDAKDAGAVYQGMKVTVEPAMPIGPDAGYGSVSHQIEVTGLAVTGHPNRPLAVSSSLDRSANVWDLTPPAGKPRTQTRLPHPVGVRSVAATGPKAGAQQRVATGGEDGKVRIWAVPNPDKIDEKAVTEAEDVHAAGVTAMAFSPDGKFLATAAGREVFVRDAAGKKLYALPAEHKDVVSAVRFTPQGALVTACHDKSVRVWKVGSTGAAAERTLDHRKGNIDALGVSGGGGRLLFDQDDGRIDLVALPDMRVVGSIRNAVTSARFATLALFSPDDSLVLTAAADGDAKGELQVWETPQPGGRGAERQRLVTPGRVSPTCAAFAADGDKRLVVVGTAAGGVHVWTLSAAAEMSRTRTGVVKSIIRIDPRTLKVRVETDTLPGEVGNLLQDKGAATIIIRPGEAPRANPLPLPGNAAAPAAGGDVVPAGGFVAPGLGVTPVAAVGPRVAPVLTAPTAASLVPVVAPPTSVFVPPAKPSPSITGGK